MNTMNNYLVVLKAKHGVRFYAVQASNVDDAIAEAVLNSGGKYRVVVSARKVDTAPMIITEQTA